MGLVTLLSGQPKEGIQVEARAESKGYYEEATTDSSGFYRLRGLMPDTTYIIKVAKKNDLGGASIERASPESIVVKVVLPFTAFIKRAKFLFAAGSLVGSCKTIVCFFC